MDTKDAWILLAGAALGYVGNLIATFTAPSVSSAFGKLRSGFIERNRVRALAAYAEVRDLKSGKRDKYLYAINHWGFVSLLILGGLIAALMGLATGRTFNLHMKPEQTEIVRVYWLTMGCLVAGLFVIVRRIFRLFLTLGRLENFEHYRAELLQRWPDIKLPE